MNAGSHPPINSQLTRKIVGAQQAQAAAGGGAGSITLTPLGGGTPIVLRAGHAQILGRSAQADIVIDKAQISGRHVRLLFDGRSVQAEDLGSTNGTYSNGSKISRTVLNAGDVLQLTADPAVARFSVGSPVSDGLGGGWVLAPLSAGLPNIVLSTGRSVTVGRSPDNDVVINRQQISGRHCRISADAAGNITIEDCRSTNGTFVDDLAKRIDRAALLPGQTVYLANRDIAYRLTQS